MGFPGLAAADDLLEIAAVPVLEYDFPMRAIRKLVDAGGKWAFYRTTIAGGGGVGVG